MKACQIVAPRKIEIIDIAIPDISSHADGSVLVKNYRSTICGSDIPFFGLERPSSRFPLDPGLSMHECIGFVAASRSDRFEKGDKVLAVPSITHRGLSEYFLSHEDLTIPLTEFDNIDYILMSQPLGTVICALRKLGNLLNTDTVVIGQGPMGLLITHMLSNLGAKTVIGTDLLDYRLEASKQMRATHTINPTKEDPVNAVKEITNGRMADLVVEAVGHQTETINQCLDFVKQGGTVLAFGVPANESYDFRFGAFFNKNVRLISSVGPDSQNDYPLAMDMITQGRIDVSPLITHHFPFSEVQRAFELALYREDQAIKIVLEYDGAFQNSEKN